MLSKVGGADFAQKALGKIEDSQWWIAQKKRPGFRIFLRENREGGFPGTVLAAFQQITGINAVVNYAPIIFELTGVAGETALTIDAGRPGQFSGDYCGAVSGRQLGQKDAAAVGLLG